MHATVFATLMVAAVAAQPVSRPEPKPQPEPTSAGEVRPVAATISAAAFLEGNWSESRPSARGTEFMQEVWSAPAGNNMVGMFRWVNGAGTSIVFELLTITEEDGSLVLRLRHQNAKGVAWEERENPATFTLGEMTPTKLSFVDTGETCDLSACEYEFVAPATLKITVKFDAPGREDLVFNLVK